MGKNDESLARRFYDEVINQKKLEILDELVADDFVEHEEFPGIGAGPEAPRQFAEMVFAAFPDVRMEVEDLIIGENKEVVRGRMTGTHEGTFADIPATGNKVDVKLIDIMEVRDGKVTAHWGLTDMMTMMQQLGVIPE